jgi:hypothetical protein
VRSKEEVALVLKLVLQGLNDCDVARRTGIPRSTIRQWRIGQLPNFDRPGSNCPVCAGDPMTLPQLPYTYLLGLYLGDGYIASHPRGVYRLRISCANAYPELIRCQSAMVAVLPSKVSLVPCQGCTEVASYSKHWPCLFP